MPGRSSACAPHAPSVRRRARASNAASVLPIGLTTPAPVTAIGPSAASGRSRPAGPRRLAASLPGLAATASSIRSREVLEGDAGLARVEPFLGNADVEAVLDREHELHERERIEAQLLERRLRARTLSASTLNLSDQHGRNGSEGRTGHAARPAGEGGRARILCPVSGAAPAPRAESLTAACIRRSGACRLAAQLARPPLRRSFRRRAPLAERLRPKTLDEVIGQQHLLGAGKPLARRVRVGAAALDDPRGARPASARRRWRV